MHLLVIQVCGLNAQSNPWLLIWKRMLPLKNTAQRVLATLCNPLLSAGVIGNLSTLLPWPLNQFDNGSESLGHALVLVLGLSLLMDMKNIKESEKDA